MQIYLRMSDKSSKFATGIISMNRAIIILIVSLGLCAALRAEDSVPIVEVNDLPIIEVKADRTMIYPQRMDLTGEETLLDVLQMMPDLMIGGYEDVISDYNLRIDNTPINGDVRLVLSQMKAKDIAKIQVCTNTGVAKGTIGTGNVLDINMVMPDTVKGFVEGQGGFGLGATPNAMANMSAVCYKYRYTVKPFLIVPIIGAMFADLINTAIITLFLNLVH